ncbi:MAG: hypothetical protein II921_04030 [Treponema sp.]|nr:hypothetical protein [Treponema sp.]
MCKSLEELVKEEIDDNKMELALENLEDGLVHEEQIERIFHLTPEQAEKVIELYRQKAPVQA